MDGPLPLTFRPTGLASVPMVIDINFFSDKVLAAGAHRQAPEWPLHPGRLHAGLVSVLHEITDPDAFSAAEAAIRWMEGLGCPEVHAADGVPFPVLPHFVPFNDKSISASAKTRGMEACLPDSPRRRRERMFPGVVISAPVIRFVWMVDQDALALHRESMHRLLVRLTYFGRSVNMCVARLLETPPSELPRADKLQRWIPDPHGSADLRVAEQGTLAALRSIYAGTMIGSAMGTARYRPPGEPEWIEEAVVPSMWASAWSAYDRTDGALTPIRSVEVFAKAVRQELVRRARLQTGAPDLSSPVDPWISGHAADLSPHRGERVGILPLCNVLHDQHPSGVVLGFTFLMPKNTPMERAEQLAALLDGFDCPSGRVPPFSKIRVPSGDVHFTPIGRQPPVGLTPRRYIGPATTWATVTPVRLARFPKTAERGELRRLVVSAFVNSGLPEPRRVDFGDDPFFQQLPRARDFTQERERQKFAIHVAAVWDQPIAGPILVGGGRYHGIGLMAPLQGEQNPFALEDAVHG